MPGSISTAQASDWHSTASWLGNVLPSLTDQAFVNHALTISSNVTCGGVGTGSAAITIGSAGQINVTSNMTFYLAGFIDVSSGGLFSVPSGVTVYQLTTILPADISMGVKLSIILEGLD